MKIQNMKLFYGFIVIACLYMDFVQGGCLSYGHSCWGGHGKRGVQPKAIRPPPKLSQLDIPERWAFVRLQPEKNYGGSTSMTDLNRRSFKDTESEENFIFNSGQQTSLENLPFLQISSNNNNDLDLFSKEFDSKLQQQQDLQQLMNGGNNKYTNKKYSTSTNNHQLNSNTNKNNNNNNNGYGNNNGVSGGLLDSSYEEFSDADLSQPIDDLLESKNMKFFKILSKPLEPNLLP